jgi:hypothetical protein
LFIFFIHIFIFFRHYHFISPLTPPFSFSPISFSRRYRLSPRCWRARQRHHAVGHVRGARARHAAIFAIVFFAIAFRHYDFRHCRHDARHYFRFHYFHADYIFIDAIIIFVVDFDYFDISLFRFRHTTDTPLLFHFFAIFFAFIFNYRRHIISRVYA